MATYNYICDTCGDEKEIKHKMTAESLTTCPKCGAETFRKKIGVVAVKYKGTGFYVNE